MKKIIFIILSILFIELTLYFFIGFPFSQIGYIFGYKPNDFPYKICEENKLCEIKTGELFAHEWFSNDKNCLSSASAGYAYRANYRYSSNIKDTGKKSIIKFPKNDWMFSCPMREYYLFKTEKSDEEYYFAVDYKCIDLDCEEKVIKSPVKIVD